MISSTGGEPLQPDSGIPKSAIGKGPGKKSSKPAKTFKIEGVKADTGRLEAAKELMSAIGGRKVKKLAQNPLKTAHMGHAELLFLTLQHDFSTLDAILDAYVPSSNIQTGEQLSLDHALLMLKSCRAALRKICPELQEEQFYESVKDILFTSKPESMAGEIKKAFVKGIKSQNLKRKLPEFLTCVEVERAKTIPSTLTHACREAVETSACLSNSLSKAYLEMRDKDLYKPQIEFLESTQGSFRLGLLKKQPEVQGMLLNGHLHTVKDSQEKELAQVVRSGAFSVHGQEGPGLDRLIKEGRGVLLSNGQSRIDLCVAQALPKVTQGLELILNNDKAFRTACRAGELLYVEQSFLSTGQTKERTMCEDMKGALDFMKEHFTVVVSGDKKSEGISEEIKSPGHFVLTLYKEEMVKPITFSLRPVLFVQGVNERQTLGRIIDKQGVKYQDKINVEGLNSLLAYAQKAKMLDALGPLREHYSKESSRLAKDIEGVDFIHDAARALGGVCGLSCKTGKDRTGAEAARILARDAKKPELQKELIGGISYALTGFNTGKANGYAFNQFQFATLPPDWHLPLEYCGSGPT